MPTTVAAASARAYRPRVAEHTVLHQVVRLHLPSFLRTADEGGGVPPFVEREPRQFLTCGVWSKGFARFRCDACHAEQLVPLVQGARRVSPTA